MKKLNHLITILAFSVVTVFSVRADDTYLTYAEFIRHAKSGRIQTVELTDYSSITGTMSSNDGMVPFKSYASTGSKQDPLLNDLLEEKNIAVSFAESRNDADSFSYFISFYGFSMMLVPWASLLLLILCFRRLGQIRKQNQC